MEQLQEDEYVDILSLSPSSPTLEKKERTILGKRRLPQDAVCSLSDGKRACVLEVDPSMPKSSVMREQIDAYLERKRASINRSNVAEFIERPPSQRRYEIAEGSCSRATTARIVRNNQIQRKRVVNDDSPLSSTTAEASGDSLLASIAGRGGPGGEVREVAEAETASTGTAGTAMVRVHTEQEKKKALENAFDERLLMLEGYLNVPTAPVAPSDIYARLSAIERHVIALEEKLGKPIGSHERAILKCYQRLGMPKDMLLVPTEAADSTVGPSSAAPPAAAGASVSGSSASESAASDAMDVSDMQPVVKKQPWAKERDEHVQVLRAK